MSSMDNRMPMSTVLIISAAFAVVFLVLFMWVGGFGFFGAFLLGLLVGIAVFVVLTFVLGDGSDSGSGPVPRSANDKDATRAATTPTAAAATPGAAVATPPDAGPAKAGAAKADTSASDPRPGGAPAGAAKAAKSATAKAKAKPKSMAKPKAKGASAAATATTATPADATRPGSGAAKGAKPAGPKPGAKGASAAQATPDAGAPGALAAPRGGGADNLKEIKGVGPKLETMLHGMGIYHFDQIAGWGDAEVAWADENIKGVKGRVSRDGWVEQARILAAGGETEFSKKVDKGGVY